MKSITFKARTEVRNYATNNKQAMNLSEVRMWIILKGSHYNFRRQKTLGNYICDFVSLKHKIIIEVDGISHENKGVYDTKRDDYLIAHGYKILKFVGMIPYPNDLIHDFVWGKIQELEQGMSMFIRVDTVE